MRVPLGNYGHNDPINNPDDNKYGGTYITPDGIVIQVNPGTTPLVFPPDGIAADGTVISPNCASKNTPNPESHLPDGIAAFCDTSNLGTYDFIWVNILVGDVHLYLTGKTIDAGKAYQQGSTVCRPHDQWHGSNLIKDDCRHAFGAIKEKCECLCRSQKILHN